MTQFRFIFGFKFVYWLDPFFHVHELDLQAKKDPNTVTNVD